MNSERPASEGILYVGPKLAFDFAKSHMEAKRRIEARNLKLRSQGRPPKHIAVRLSFEERRTLRESEDRKLSAQEKREAETKEKDATTLQEPNSPTKEKRIVCTLNSREQRLVSRLLKKVPKIITENRDEAIAHRGGIGGRGYFAQDPARIVPDYMGAITRRARAKFDQELERLFGRHVAENFNHAAWDAAWQAAEDGWEQAVLLPDSPGPDISKARRKAYDGVTRALAKNLQRIADKAVRFSTVLRRARTEKPRGPGGTKMQAALAKRDAWIRRRYQKILREKSDVTSKPHSSRSAKEVLIAELSRKNFLPWVATRLSIKQLNKILRHSSRR